jgi:hypothetical protein
MDLQKSYRNINYQNLVEKYTNAPMQNYLLILTRAILIMF